MREKRQLIKKEEKDGETRTVTKVEETKIYWVHEYYDKKTGSFGTITFDEEGEIVGGAGCCATESAKSAFED